VHGLAGVGGEYDVMIVRDFKASYLTSCSIALSDWVLFNVLPHETDVSARAIKEF